MADPIGEAKRAAGGPALLSMGFRPFFLAAGLFAAIAIPLYLALLDGAVGSAGAPVFWHGHEMLFGYAAAVLSGFLLTAVPNWTGAAPVRGRLLLILVCLWLAGRVAMWFDGSLPAIMVALIDLLLLPALALAVRPALVAARNRRNYIFFALLAVLTLANFMMHAGNAGWLDSQWLRRGQFLALDIVLLMIALIGGRIIPAFTGNWLQQRRKDGPIAARPWIDRAALIAMVAVVIADLAAGDRSQIVGIACLAAAGLIAIRLSGWRGGATVGEPILAVLHVGYGWLAVGLAVRGLDNFFGLFSGAAGLHGLTIGAIGTMTTAVMSRAALGHTGNPLRAGGLLVCSYALISLAALIRLAGGLPLALDAHVVLMASGIAWTLAFLAFLGALGPALALPRRVPSSP